MTKEIWKGITILVADDGAYLFNGDTFSERVYLGSNAKESDWRDATAEEKAEYERQQELDPVTEEEALVRYANELTGQQDETLTEATETLIKTIIEEE